MRRFCNTTPFRTESVTPKSATSANLRDGGRAASAAVGTTTSSECQPLTAAALPDSDAAQLVNESTSMAAIFLLRRALVLAVPCVGLTYYIGRPWRWFSWHPLLMTLAFIAAAGSGILVKRKGGRVNTILHGSAMVFAFVLAMLGWYVIREQKKMLGKPHNTSWRDLNLAHRCGTR